MNRRLLLGLLLGGLMTAQSEVRFDHKVRDMFFAGFAGDKESLAKGMEITEATLKAEPNHPEALVWHGSGLFFSAGAKFQAGDAEAGMKLFAEGTGMMDKAVELAPKNIGVRIPRGAGYLAASRAMPPQIGTPLIEKGLSDYMTSWELQKNDLSGFSQHSLGELWIGIADANARLGKTDRAKEFFTMIQQKLPNTPWSKKADKWFAEGKLTGRDGNCVGCHTGSPKAVQN